MNAMTRAERALPEQEPFDLRIVGHHAPLRVLRFDGREAMNELYAFEVAVQTDAEDALLGSVLDSAATLSIRHDGHEVRSVHGVVDACETIGRTASGVSLLETARSCRPSARRILMTTYHDLPSIVAGLHSGAIERLVQKPFSAAELMAAILPERSVDATDQRASA